MLNGVAKTSLLVAAMRARESQRSEQEGRLFVDPFAEILAGAEGLAIMQSALEESGDQPAIAVRTRYMDDKFKSSLADGVRQIVMLASGMDSRAFRLDFPEGTIMYELDQNDVHIYKEQKLQNVPAKCIRKTLAVDLRDDWAQNLLKACFHTSEKTLWMVEGLIMYIEESQVLTLFNRINSRCREIEKILRCLAQISLRRTGSTPTFDLSFGRLVFFQFGDTDK